MCCRTTAPLTGFWQQHDNPVQQKLSGLVPIEEGSALLFFVQGSGWQRFIHSFKYFRRFGLAREVGRWYGSLLKESGLYDDVEVVVPLPLHPFKRLSRGYNQVDFLAEGIAESLGLPVERRSLVRCRNTHAQARTPHRERAANVEGAFAVRHSEYLAGRHLLLVDDVLTTGSTLTAAAEALLEAVPEVQISIAALAVSRREVGIAD